MLQERLHEAGLVYLRRRKKALVPKKYLDDRCAYSRRVLHLQQSALDDWAYTDGTIFFLDKEDTALESTQRQAMGISVWRRADRTDALYDECIGPSIYSKAQGQPIKVWGMLAKGELRIMILPPGVSMNRWWYAWVVKRYFLMWLNGCLFLLAFVLMYLCTCGTG